MLFWLVFLPNYVERKHFQGSFQVFFIPFLMLLKLLVSVVQKAVLSAHDTVAQKNFDPVLPPLPEDVDNDLKEESVKIVRLVKNKEPLVRKTM